MTSSGSTSPPWRGPGATATPADAPLLVVLLRASDEHVLVVVGEADVSTADQLRDHLAAALVARPPALRVELDALDFCDLAGLDALHDAARTAADLDVRLTFSGMSAQLAWLHRTVPSTSPPSPRSCSPVRRRGATADQPHRLETGRQRPRGAPASGHPTSPALG